MEDVLGNCNLMFLKFSVLPVQLIVKVHPQNHTTFKNIRVFSSIVKFYNYGVKIWLLYSHIYKIVRLFTV